jgi:DNA-binding beta-propeller fold protein YncE
LIANVSLGVEPSGIAVSQTSEATVFVSTNDSELLLINGTSGQTEEETSLPYYNSYSSTPVLETNPTTNAVFALYENSTQTILTAINGTNGKVIYSSSIGSACYVDSNRYYLNPHTDEIYASYSQGNSSFFLIINGRTGQLSNMLSTEGHVYVGSAYNPQSNEIYLLVGSGELISLALPVAQTYVNSSLLADSSCSIVPA